MKRSDAFYDQHYLFINAALIASHANGESPEFRQKDIKFFIELLSNWMETSFKDHCLIIQNTQVQRLLDQLTTEGILKKNLKNKRPHYQFTSIGVLELINRLVSDKSLEDLENFFFLYHIVALYSDKMQGILLKRSSELPKSYIIEIQHLLNPANLVERQSRRITLEIKKLEIRIKEAKEITKISEKMLQADKGISEIVKKIESTFPYQLNNQRKMTDFFKTLSPDIQYIELTAAPTLRAETLWEPLLKYYQNYLHNLSKLQCN